MHFLEKIGAVNNLDEVISQIRENILTDDPQDWMGFADRFKNFLEAIINFIQSNKKLCACLVAALLGIGDLLCRYVFPSLIHLYVLQNPNLSCELEDYLMSNSSAVCIGGLVSMALAIILWALSFLLVFERFRSRKLKNQAVEKERNRIFSWLNLVWVWVSIGCLLLLSGTLSLDMVFSVVIATIISSFHCWTLTTPPSIDRIDKLRLSNCILGKNDYALLWLLCAATIVIVLAFCPSLPCNPIREPIGSLDPAVLDNIRIAATIYVLLSLFWFILFGIGIMASLASPSGALSYINREKKAKTWNRLVAISLVVLVLLVIQLFFLCFTVWQFLNAWIAIHTIIIQG